MGLGQYYNKIINLEILSKIGLTKKIIKTPLKGRKPQIQISGSIVSDGMVSSFEVRVTNLYADDIEVGDGVRITAGYESQLSKAIEGVITAAYTENPGPDRVTVLMCQLANFESWNNSTLDLHLLSFFTLSEALNKISKALGFQTAYVHLDLMAKTSNTPLDFGGCAKDAIGQVKERFEGVNIVVYNNRIWAYPDKYQISNTYTIPYLKSPPQFMAGSCTITAPWNPNIKPGDIVIIPINFYSMSMNSKVSNKIQVLTIDFDFDTTGGANEMNITGSAI